MANESRKCVLTTNDTNKHELRTMKCDRFAAHYSGEHGPMSSIMIIREHSWFITANSWLIAFSSVIRGQTPFLK